MPVSYEKRKKTKKNTDWFFDLEKVSFSDLYLGVGCCCLVVRSNQTELCKVESEPSERMVRLNSSIWLHDYTVSEKNSVPAPMLLYQFLNTFLCFFAAQSSFGMFAVLEEDTLFSD